MGKNVDGVIEREMDLSLSCLFIDVLVIPEVKFLVSAACFVHQLIKIAQIWESLVNVIQWRLK